MTSTTREKSRSELKARARVVFPRRLVDRMRELGIKQKDLAGRLGTTQSRVSEWVSGKHLPNNESFRRIATALEVEVSWLRGESGDEPLEGTLPLMEGVPNRVREALLLRGMALEDLKISEVARQQALGSRKPRRPQLRQIAAALGVRFAWLAYDVGKAVADPEVSFAEAAGYPVVAQAQQAKDGVYLLSQLRAPADHRFVAIQVGEATDEMEPGSQLLVDLARERQRIRSGSRVVVEWRDGRTEVVRWWPEEHAVIVKKIGPGQKPTLVREDDVRRVHPVVATIHPDVS